MSKLLYPDLIFTNIRMGAVVILPILLSGCLGNNGIPLAATCRLYEYIKASPHDTPNTLRQIRKNNTAFRKACIQ